MATWASWAAELLRLKDGLKLKDQENLTRYLNKAAELLRLKDGLKLEHAD